MARSGSRRTIPVATTESSRAARWPSDVVHCGVSLQAVTSWLFYTAMRSRRGFRAFLLFGCLGTVACSPVGGPAAEVPVQAFPIPPPKSEPESVPIAPLSALETSLRDALAAEMRALCEFGPRSLRHSWNLHGATDHISRSLERAGYEVQRQGFEVGEELLQNLEVVLLPQPVNAPVKAAAEALAQLPLQLQSPLAARALVVAAHYDTAAESVGADSAASGAAALLVLARALKGVPRKRPLRLVWLTNESGSTGTKGSEVYVQALERQRAEVSGVIVLRGLGHYSVQANSQSYPEQLLYGDNGRTRRGDFLGVVYNPRSDSLFQRLSSQWQAASLPIQALILPESSPLANSGPQVAFWKAGWLGLSLTDTEGFRDTHYNNPEDTPDRLDMNRYARAVAVVEAVIRQLIGAPVTG